MYFYSILNSEKNANKYFQHSKIVEYEKIIIKIYHLGGVGKFYRGPTVGSRILTSFSDFR